MTRLAIALTLVLSAGLAHAEDAKDLFDQGIALYQEGAFDDAAELLGQSYAMSKDAKTLFAWAQAEKNAGNCEAAVPLFDRLLEDKGQSRANRNAIAVLRTECAEQLAAQESEPEPEPPAPEPEPPLPVVEPTGARDGSPSWYADPIGAPLVAVGVVGVGVGIGFFVSALSKDSQADDAQTQGEFRDLTDTAESRQTIAIISSVAGVVALGAGITYYMLRSDDAQSRTNVSVWSDGSASGVGVSGRF